MTIRTTNTRWRRQSERVSIGPQLGFAVATFAGFAAWGASKAMLPPDLVMPALSTLFLVFAAAFAVIAW